MTNVQQIIEKERAYYTTRLSKPLLAQLAELHGISIRDFAGIFGISKGHAEAVLKHKTMPSLELAFQIARYFEVTVDSLFGWRVDDIGSRRPLVVMLPTGVMRLNKNTDHGSINLVKAVADLAEALHGETD